jgi:hypothetical protein
MSVKIQTKKHHTITFMVSASYPLDDRVLYSMMGACGRNKGGPDISSPHLYLIG